MAAGFGRQILLFPVNAGARPRIAYQAAILVAERPR
jgi:hypothetical protein